MASTAPSTSEMDTEADRHDMALDAAGKLSEAYERRARRVIQHDLPAVKHAVRNCETDEQKRRYLEKLREDDEAAYVAFGYEVPGEIAGEVEEDPDAERKRAEHAYTGPYVSPWDQSTESRVLECDSNGRPIAVQQRQRELFGIAWTRTWQNGPLRAREDLMGDLGPMGETADFDVAPPAGMTWEELGETQRKEKKGYEKARTRRLRGENEILAAVREFFRGVRMKLMESRARGKTVEVPRGEAVVDKTSGKALDSGYASVAKG